MTDDEIIAELVGIRGIGRWTAEMFLIFHLMRPNVLPLDDVGLLNGISRNYFSGDPVSRSDAREVAAAWTPYCSVATWYIWRSLDPAAGGILSRRLGGSRLEPTACRTEPKERTLAKKTFLDFEHPIAELETKIEELRYVQTESAVDISEEIDQLSKKSQQLTKDIYSDLTPVADHQDRAPSGASVHAGLRQRDLHRLHRAARRPPFRRRPVASSAAWPASTATPAWCWASRRGATPRSAALRNFGMSRPEGYRKALRLMKTAEKFKLPVFTFVDTPGAYPGIDAEERGQSEAIGRNIFEMCQLEVPIITTVIGEGGSGGALAISVADQVLMLQYSIYSVISPEGCASILWKTSDKAQDAADAMGITAHRLKALGLIDKIVNEPVGGAHRDHKQMAAFLKRALNDAWRQLSDLKVRELLERRYERLQSYGRFTDTKADAR